MSLTNVFSSCKSDAIYTLIPSALSVIDYSKMNKTVQKLGAKVLVLHLKQRCLSCVFDGIIKFRFCADNLSTVFFFPPKCMFKTICNMITNTSVTCPHFKVKSVVPLVYKH